MKLSEVVERLYFYLKRDGDAEICEGEENPTDDVLHIVFRDGWVHLQSGYKGVSYGALMRKYEAQGTALGGAKSALWNVKEHRDRLLVRVDALEGLLGRVDRMDAAEIAKRMRAMASELEAYAAKRNGPVVEPGPRGVGHGAPTANSAKIVSSDSSG